MNIIFPGMVEWKKNVLLKKNALYTFKKFDE